jgi:hypothetical protein
VKHALSAVVVAALLVASVSAQQPAPAPAPAPKPQPAGPPVPMPKPPSGPGAPVTLLRVQLVLSKYKGDKKVSNLPYTLSVSTDQMARMRIGADVPYTTSTFAPVKPATGSGDKPVQPPQPSQAIMSHQYRTVGTNIDCSATPLGNGAFKLDITVNDSSMSPKEPDTSGPDVPTFRHFVVTNSLVLKEGQSGQLTSATDPVTAETLRVDVSLTVLK